MLLRQRPGELNMESMTLMSLCKRDRQAFRAARARESTLKCMSVLLFSNLRGGRAHLTPYH